MAAVWKRLLYEGEADITVDNETSHSDVLVDGDIGVTVQAYDADTLTNVVIQTFTASGTYTPTAGMVKCIVEVQAPGGGGGGPQTGHYNAGGGGAGGYAKKLLTAADIGASQTVTINAANPGTGGAIDANGVAGGSVTFGAIITCNGGLGGGAGGAGSAGGSASGGDINITGGSGTHPIRYAIATIYGNEVSGNGGSSILGGGGTGGYNSISQVAASGYGGGGGGGCSNGTDYFAGLNGSPAIVIVTEFCS